MVFITIIIALYFLAAGIDFAFYSKVIPMSKGLVVIAMMIFAIGYVLKEMRADYRSRNHP